MLHNSVKVVSTSGIEGKGLVATELIPVNTVVWELGQEETSITKDKLLTLPDEVQKLYYQSGKDEYILVTDKSDVLNHSCDPNLWWEGDTKLVARRDIQESEEITYDYATSDNDPEAFPGFHCNCGSKNCRRFVSWKDSQDPLFQEKYKGHLPSWIVKEDI
jgi:uncharacterized protein